MEKLKYSVVIADDSAIIRGLLEKAFKGESDFEVMESVSNGRKLLDAVKQHVPDLVVSDIDMPEMNGLEAGKIITSEIGSTLVIFSEEKGKKSYAEEAGAILFEVKPVLSELRNEMLKAFIGRIRETLLKNGIKPHRRGSDTDRHETFGSYKILCIGASTGGPTAVQTVLSKLGDDFSLPIVYVQHLDVGSDVKMVDWFNSSCPNLVVELAQDGQEAKRGHVYLAPAERHLIVDSISHLGNPVLKLSDEPEERFLRPAVNKLFRSAAKLYGSACLAVLMTGMGRDGADGCQMVVECGGHTIVEDKSTCAVFGMPAAAIEQNAANEILPRDKIARRILVLTGNIGG